MAVDPICPKCGGVMPGDAPQGHCPSCLMALALGDEQLETSTESPSDVGRPGLSDVTTQPSKVAHAQPTDTIGQTSHSENMSRVASDVSPSLGSIRYFGDYELISEIARGGMGVVYRARQVSLNRPVALKMILAGQLAGEDEIRRFRVEAEAAANLDHPRIVPIFEVGQHDGQHYFSMGFVEGESLAQKLAVAPLLPREAASVMKLVAEAIAYAHGRGVIHRDLKPANIMVDRDGNPRVTDFGLAKKVRGDSDLTSFGQIMGSPSYMPPEQARGHRGDIGPAADVYGLGATLYALVTGRPPFQAASAMDTLTQVINDEPVPPRQLNASIPRDLETICLKCLEKEVERRYPSAAALADDLGRWLRGEPILARPAGGMERVVKWTRRRPLAATLAVVSLLASLSTVGLIVAWRYNGQLRQARDGESVQRERAESRERQARSYGYAADIGLSQRMWESGRATEAVALLERLVPKPGGEDLRGFEWYYLRRLYGFALSHFQALTPASFGYSQVQLCFSPDGRSLYVSQNNIFPRNTSADIPGLIAAWDPASGVRRNVIRESPTLSIARFGGERFAFLDGNRAWIGDLATGDCEPLAELALGPARFEAVSPDGRSALFYIDDAEGAKRRIIDLTNGREKAVLPENVYASYDNVAASPDGRWLAVGRAGPDVPVIHVWDLTECREKVVIHPTFQRVTAGLAISANGKVIATAGMFSGSTIDRPVIEFWDVMSSPPRITHRLDLEKGDIQSIAIGADCRTLAVSCRGDRFLRIFRLTFDPAVLNDVGVWREHSVLRGATGEIRALALSGDGFQVAAGDTSGAITVWDTRIVPEADKAPIDSTYMSPVFLHDSRTLALNSCQGIDLIDTATGQRVGRAEIPSCVNGFAVAPDGRSLAISWREGGAGDRQWVRLWDIAARRTVMTLGVEKIASNLDEIGYSPDGKILAAGTFPAELGGRPRTSTPVTTQKSLWLWDLPTGQERTPLDGAVAPFAFSPDGRMLATAGKDNRSIRIWDTATGAPVGLWTESDPTDYGHMAFSPDGTLLAAASGNRRGARVWNVSSGRVVLTLGAPRVPVIAFAPDGKTLVTSEGDLSLPEGDQSLTLWQVSTGLELLTLRGHRYPVTGFAFSPDGSILASSAVRMDMVDPVFLWKTYRSPWSRGR
jgi:WD40 repeat protein